MPRVIVKARPLCQARQPVHRRAPAPVVGRLGQRFGADVMMPFGPQIVERAIDVAQGCPAFGAEELGRDHCLAPRLQAPGAGEADDRAARQIQRGCGVILDLPRRIGQRRALGVKPAFDARDLGPAQRPQRQVDQVDAQIDHAAAA